MEKRLENIASEIKEKAREVIFTFTDAIGNEYHMKLKKDAQGDFKLSGMGNSLSNWQLVYNPFEIEWAADAENWKEVVMMIDSGVKKLISVISR